MIRSVGLDVHKDSVQVCFLNSTGELRSQETIPCTREALQQFAQERLLPTDRVALEATMHTWAIVALLEPSNSVSSPSPKWWSPTP